ncbi:MAG: LysM peptidoglycan-binding domain-containing protein, partial [Acidimicrobiales bacterium]
MSISLSRRAAMLRAVSWSGLCLVVMVGAPYFLYRVWGLPPPSGGLGLGLGGFGSDTGPLAGEGLIDVLVWAGWLTWAWFVIALCVEVAQACAGHRPRLVRGLGPAQGLAAKAVGAILLFRALTASVPTGPPPTPTALVASLSASPSPFNWTPVAGSAHPGRTGAGRSSARLPGSAGGQGSAARERTYVVKRGDTLWGIAQSQ